MQRHDTDAAPASPARRKLMKGAAGLAAAGAMLAAGGWVVVERRRDLFEVRRERTLMQTSVAITCLASDVRAAGTAIDAAFERMASVVAQLSRFDPDSPVARLNRDGHLPNLPVHTRSVLQHALAFARLTEGDFDISVLPVQQYIEALPRPVVLTPGERSIIARREHLIGYRGIVMDGQQVRLARPGMAITLDGIAKGYVVDQGIAALKDAGIEYGLIDAGGEIRAMAGADPRRHWNVGIVDPHRTSQLAAVVQLRNAAFSTSGNYEVFYSADRRLFHIINPHTGYSPGRYASMTVMADASVTTDAMSVAAFMMEPSRLKEVMAARHCQWLAIARDGSRSWRSRDLPMIRGRAEVV